jgi:hypothetical protein
MQNVVNYQEKRSLLVGARYAYSLQHWVMYKYVLIQNAVHRTLMI